MKIAAILLLAGNSSRFKSTTQKQLFSLNGKQVFEYPLNEFIKNKNINDIVVVCNSKTKKVVEKGNWKKTKIIVGGSTRQESVYKGINCLNYEANDYVIIHDGARPLIDQKIINDTIKNVKKYNAVTTFINVEDTISKTKKNNFIDCFVNRTDLVKIQTPQAFRFDLIKKAHEKSCNKNATDDCTLVKNLKHEIKLIPGNKKLTKITTIEDIKYLESLIKND